MAGFETDEDEGALHSVKFIEDVPLMMIVEIGRTEMQVQDILNLKKGIPKPKLLKEMELFLF
jgi:flagellar motor switch/type III secretory pathway protein FliN